MFLRLIRDQFQNQKTLYFIKEDIVDKGFLLCQDECLQALKATE